MITIIKYIIICIIIVFILVLVLYLSAEILWYFGFGFSRLHNWSTSEEGCSIKAVFIPFPFLLWFIYKLLSKWEDVSKKSKEQMKENENTKRKE